MNMKISDFLCEKAVTRGICNRLTKKDVIDETWLIF